MRLLDLFCGAGGAAMGYHRAGFEVIGVDHRPQPNYPFRFIQDDALDHLDELLSYVQDGDDIHAWADAIHASPPCQKWTAYARRPNHVREYPDLIEPIRETLKVLGLPYIIENIEGAPLVAPVKLCGSSFGLDVRRHRFFESSVLLSAPPCNHAAQTPRFPQATNRTNLRSTVEVGVWRIPLDVQHKAMGIDWMTLPELSEAVPPAYTEHLGRQLLSWIEKNPGCGVQAPGQELFCGEQGAYCEACQGVLAI